MSYRDLRNFTEMMRALGYGRLISMDHFRTSNFAMIADILIWLVKRFEPEAEMHVIYPTEDDRVLLVRSAAEVMALKGNVFLNTKRLYQADGYAVKELLKVANLLYEALRAHDSDNRRKAHRGYDGGGSTIDVTSYIQDLRQSRDLASQVTSKGAVIYDLLTKEVEMRDARNASIGTLWELGKVDGAVLEAIAFTKDSTQNTRTLIEKVAATESSLDAKIEKKQTELDRNQKRLMTLKKVRPAFLEEFERHEIELQELYQTYVTRTRSIAYLEQQQDEATMAEHERLQTRLKETRRLVEEDQELEESRKLSDNVALAGDGPREPTRRLRTATAAKGRLTSGRGRVYGSMLADEEDDRSFDSESDLVMYDDDDDDDDEDDHSDILGSGDDLAGLPLESKSEPSDDDF